MSNQFFVQVAETQDVADIMAIFIKCTDLMLAKGIKQWDYTYPTKEGVEADIAKGEVYVLKEQGQLCAAITLNEQQDAQYQNIAWAIDTTPVLVIHRLAVDPQRQGKGYGKQLCIFAEQWAKENAYQAIRLDAYSGNLASNYLYQQLNYQQAKGYCYFHGNELPFNCYEKAIF